MRMARSGLGGQPDFLPIAYLPVRSAAVVFFCVRFGGFGGRGRVDGQADAAPELIDFALDVVAALHEVVEDRLVPLQAGVRDELHPVAARGLVGRLGDAFPDRHVGIPAS